MFDSSNSTSLNCSNREFFVIRYVKKEAIFDYLVKPRMALGDIYSEPIIKVFSDVKDVLELFEYSKSQDNPGDIIILQAVHSFINGAGVLESREFEDISPCSAVISGCGSSNELVNSIYLQYGVINNNVPVSDDYTDFKEITPLQGDIRRFIFTYKGVLRQVQYSPIFKGLYFFTCNSKLTGPYYFNVDNVLLADYTQEEMLNYIKDMHQVYETIIKENTVV